MRRCRDTWLTWFIRMTAFPHLSLLLADHGDGHEHGGPLRPREADPRAPVCLPRLQPRHDPTGAVLTTHLI